MLTRASRLLDLIVVVMAALAGLLLLASAVSLLYEVLMRYFVGRPLVWVIELNEYMLLYVTFLAAPWVLRNDGHVAVDILVSAVGPRLRAVLGLLATFIGAVICLVLMMYGWEVAWDFYRRGVGSGTLLNVPKAPIVAVIPAGSLVLFLQFCRQVTRHVQTWRGLAPVGPAGGSDRRGEG